ncbi:hypothetical protein [Pararhodobacter sp. CCB-MM2]|uniref:hypothetical protein n=1 Tax=Pararhodobacter sp. CCB-MM2 TaxID=1786003 RepID=UPI0008304C4F|nr:hypothetical protein [Pararhodobacter sp. CCB-MM2]
MKSFATAFSLALVGFASAAGAECDLPQPSDSAVGWYVVEGENFAFTAVSETHPDLEIPLLTDAPVIPRVLDFVVLPRYGGRIALLQYFSGDPGTSQLVTVIRNAVVDLATGETLATPVFSADCHDVAWHWFDDHVEVADLDGRAIIALPRG